MPGSQIQKHRVHPSRLYAEVYNRRGERMKVTWPLEGSQFTDYEDHSAQFSTIYQDHVWKVRWSKTKMLYYVSMLGGKAAFWCDAADLKFIINSRKQRRISKAVCEHLRITGEMPEGVHKVCTLERGYGNRSDKEGLPA